MASSEQTSALPEIPPPSSLERLYFRLALGPEARLAEWKASLPSDQVSVGEQEHHLLIAKSMTTTDLSVALVESIEHYANYANPNQEFFPARDFLSDDHRPAIDGDLDTDSIAWWLERKDPALKRSDGTSIGLRYVTREVVPLRTALGKQETSKLSRASRRLDLLLSAPDGVPVITEVKAKRDQHPFYALVQALMFAAQLAGDSQRQRLHKYFPELAQGPGPLEICILLAGNKHYFYEPDTGWTRRPKFKPQLASEAERLSAGLLQDPTVGAILRRILWLSASMDAGRLVFEPLKHYP